jgi:hypothetical protein
MLTFELHVATRPQRAEIMVHNEQSTVHVDGTTFPQMNHLHDRRAVILEYH